jgi:hypothetical protein
MLFPWCFSPPCIIVIHPVLVPVGQLDQAKVFFIQSSRKLEFLQGVVEQVVARSGDSRRWPYEATKARSTANWAEGMHASPSRGLNFEVARLAAAATATASSTTRLHWHHKPENLGFVKRRETARNHRLMMLQENIAVESSWMRAELDGFIYELEPCRPWMSSSSWPLGPSLNLMFDEFLALYDREKWRQIGGRTVEVERWRFMGCYHAKPCTYWRNSI